MRIRAFIFGVLLLAFVGWCIVHETMKQTRARYELAEAARREAELAQRLEKLRAKELGLLQPGRLSNMARVMNLDVVALGTKPGPGMESREGGGRMAVQRRPGEVADESGRREMRMAVVGR